MEFKVDHTDLEKMIMNDDLDTLSVMLALYLYAGGMDSEEMADVRIMIDQVAYLMDIRTV